MRLVHLWQWKRVFLLIFFSTILWSLFPSNSNFTSLFACNLLFYFKWKHLRATTLGNFCTHFKQYMHTTHLDTRCCWAGIKCNAHKIVIIKTRFLSLISRVNLCIFMMDSFFEAETLIYSFIYVNCCTCCFWKSGSNVI